MRVRVGVAVVILVKNHAESLIPCRALLGSGSQKHLINSGFAQQLQFLAFTMRRLFRTSEVLH